MNKLIFIILILVSKASYSATKAPSWEIRTAPIAFLWSWATIDLSYIMNSNWAFGPSYIAYNGQTPGNMFLPSFNGSAVGAHVLWAESFTSDCYYADAHYYTENYTSYPHAYLGRYEVTGYKLNFDLGKRWILYSNVSSMLGIGYEMHNHENTAFPSFGASTKAENDSGFFHIEYKLGYFF